MPKAARPPDAIVPSPAYAFRHLAILCILLLLPLLLLPRAARSEPPLAGYATELVLDGPVAPGTQLAVTGRGAPPGDGIWVELWRIPAAGGGHISLGCVAATGGSFRFEGISAAEGDSLYATLSRSWQFSRAGDAEGWDSVTNDATLTVSGGVLRVEIRNLDGDAHTDAYFQNSFLYDPAHYRVIEVRLRNPAPPSPSRLLGIFWGAQGGGTVAEHDAVIPSGATGFETVLVPMNVGETRIAPGPVASGLDGLWAAGALNGFLRLDPLNDIPAGDRTLDGTVVEIDSIRIREDYRRDFHHDGDLAGLDGHANVSEVRVEGGALSYLAGDDPHILSTAETGPIESGRFTRLAVGLVGEPVAVEENEIALFFDDRDSVGYRDDGGAGPLQRAAIATPLGGRRDLVMDLDPASGGEWGEEGAVRTSGLRHDIPEIATPLDAVRIDYVALVGDRPFGPSVPLAVGPTPYRTVAFWDFALGLGGWAPNFDTANARITPSGLELESTGEDPWITSPAFDPPAGLALRVRFRMRSGANASGQVFYGRSFAEERSVRFSVKADECWTDYSLIIPPQPTRVRLRLDPATAPGPIALAWLRVESISPIDPPPIVPPVRPQAGAAPPARIASGPLEIVHYGERWGGFVVAVSGVEMASSHQGGVLGSQESAGAVWRDLGALPVRVSLASGVPAEDGPAEDGPAGDVLTEEVSFPDEGGATWSLVRRFEAGRVPGSLSVSVDLACDRARSVLHVPWLTLFPGLGTYGSAKRQGLFAGLEYLADEPSSSQADLTTPEHVRLVPDPSKITFPLMALERDGLYVAVTWDLSPLVAAVFDSPDRTLGSGAHLLALWAPGVGDLRQENGLFALAPFPIQPGGSLSATAAILGGEGGSVVPAIRQYVALEGLPPVPSFAGGLPAAVDLLAAGWLDSDVHAGDGLWRHAAWPGFNAQKASDAVVFLLSLASRTGDSALAARLRAEAALALEVRLRDDPAFLSGVSHVVWPPSALVLGNVPAHVAARRDGALGQTGLFDAAGIRRYPQGGANPDLGATHFADHASGYGASVLAGILEAAALSGHSTLTSRALALLDQQTSLYRDAEPRGAQTWEVPLHTPDVLASAYLVKCYVLGHELTGREDLLEEARYWAWTGVPFVYLKPSVQGPTSHYATIPVYGATNFVAPVWIGLPVQWCGLVYRSWLHRLALHDPDGPWETIARGITASGLRMTWPASDAARVGLLPDIYDIRAQERAGPPINPGTVQASLLELYGAGSLYGFRRAEGLGWLVHAPGAIAAFEERPEGSPGTPQGDLLNRVTFSVEGWGPHPYRVLLSRVGIQPAHILSRPSGTAGPHLPASFAYDRANRWLVVDASGDTDFLIARTNAPPRVSISSPAEGASFMAPATIPIEAAATDDDGEVVRIEIVAGGGTLATGATSPLAFQWRDVPEGVHTIAVRAADDAGAVGEASVAVAVSSPAARAFVRGDANASGAVDISDAIAILGYLFLGDVAPSCRKAADVTGNGVLDISDPIFLLNHLFLGGDPIPAPHPACGAEPRETELFCASFPPCGS